MRSVVVFYVLRFPLHRPPPNRVRRLVCDVKVAQVVLVADDHLDVDLAAAFTRCPILAFKDITLRQPLRHRYERSGLQGGGLAGSADGDRG